MDVTVCGRHIEITPIIREYASGKVAKLPRYFDRLQSVDVVTDKTDHPSYEVEIIAKVDPDRSVRGEGRGPGPLRMYRRCRGQA